MSPHWILYQKLYKYYIEPYKGTFLAPYIAHYGSHGEVQTYVGQSKLIMFYLYVLLCSIIVCSNSLVHIFLIHLKPIESDVVFERTFGDTAETLDTKDMRLGWTSRSQYYYLQNRSIRFVCMSWTWACHKLQLKFIPWSIHFQQSSSKNPYLSWLYFMVRDSYHAIS